MLLSKDKEVNGMALGASAIGTVRDSMGHISTAASSMNTSSETLNYVMQNGDFMKFAEDTNFGSESQAKLQKAMQGIDQMSEQINNLQSRTEEFLSEQESRNNMSF